MPRQHVKPSPETIRHYADLIADIRMKLAPYPPYDRAVMLCGAIVGEGDLACEASEHEAHVDIVETVASLAVTLTQQHTATFHSRDIGKPTTH